MKTAGRLVSARLEKIKASGEPILVFDKEGTIGQKLVGTLCEIFDNLPIVFVSKIIHPNRSSKNCVSIALSKKTPKLPSATYSYFFVVYQNDRETLELLDELLVKAKRDRARFLFLVHLSIGKQELVEKMLGSYSQSAVLVYGDLFGKDVPLDLLRPTDNLLYQARMFGSIVVSHTGLKKIYPVFLGDVVDAIVNVAFGIFEHSLFFLFPKHPPTELSFAHAMQKIEPLLRVDFDNSQGDKDLMQHDYYIPQDGEHVLEEPYLIKKKLELSHEFDVSKKNKNISLHKETKNQSRVKNKKTFFPKIFIFFLLFIFVLPFLTMFFFGFLGTVTLRGSIKQIETGDFVMAKKSATASHILFTISSNALPFVSFELSLLGLQKNAEDLAPAIGIGNQAAMAIRLGMDSITLYLSALASPGSFSKEKITKAITNAKSSIVVLQSILLDQKASSNIFFSGDSNFDKEMESVLKIASTFGNFSDVLPSIIGLDRKKTYLVLFQNNMELRPGGGFIGSYGILGFENGKVVDFTIRDVYDADGQLRGHVEPPFAIRRYLPSVHLFLRDSNFDVDFSKGAFESAFLLNQETKEVVDGVIAVDTSFVKQILKAIGPVYVSDYDETVTADNFFITAQSHAEKNFFPGSTQKKDFLRSLLVAMQAQISSKKNIPYLEILNALQDAAEQKHMQFAFADKTVQNLFAVNNLSSSLHDLRKNNQDNINDFLGVSEANLGVNKVNYFIKRQINQKVAINDDGAVTEHVTVDYDNPSSSWPGGDYKNYIRFVVPFGSKLTSIAVDGVEQAITAAITDPLVYEAKKFTAPKQLEVETAEENGKTIFGFLVTVPTQSKKTVSISYVLPTRVLLDQPEFMYSHKLFKQPGTDSDPFLFTLSYPKAFRVFNLEKKFVDKEGEIDFQTNLLQDILFSIRFSRI